MSIPGWLRPAVSACIILVVGGWTCFHKLDRGMLTVDEAWFAYTTEYMRLTGDYVVPNIGETTPHLNAAPLYNWLCCLTADWAGDGALRYRAWSAAFGIGCGLAALALGSLLFGPGAGLLAGLMVVTNHHFLFVHGIRDGRMDPGLTFFITLAVVCAVKASRSAGRGGWWWAGTGACVGLAALMKPPVFAGFFFALLALHHLLTRRDLSMRARLAGPLVGAAVALAVALPWYAAIAFRLGPSALYELIVTNSVGRTVKKVTRNPSQWWFYLVWIWESSWAFKLAGAAVLWGCLCMLRGWRRGAWGLLLLLGVAFMAAVSTAATRHWQYVYPVYPLVAVMVGGLMLAGLYHPGTASGFVSRWARRLSAMVGIAAFAATSYQDVGDIRHHWRIPRWEYPPLLIHQAAEPDIAAGRAHLILYGYPRHGDPLYSRTRPFSPSERIYLLKMPHAVIVKTADELDRLLADGLPAVVFLNHRMTPADLAADGIRSIPDAHLEMPSANGHAYPLVSFHGAADSLRLRARFAEPLCRPVSPAAPPTPPAAPPAPGGR